MDRNRGLRLAKLMVLAPLVASACVERPFTLNLNDVNEDAPQRPALIVLSDPQIHSRESLVDDRRKEFEYLTKALTASEVAVFEPQIHRQLSTVTALAGELALKYDPLGGSAAAGTADLAQLQRDIQATRLRAELLSAQRELDALGAGTTTTTTASGTVQPQTAFSSPGLVGTQAATAQAAALVTALKAMESETRKSKTTASPQEIFRDRQALRREIRSALDEINLDDVHDAKGNALYRLQFRATVFPGKEKNKFGLARITVERPKLEWDDIDRLFKALLGHVTFRLNRASEDEQLTYATLGAGGLFEIVPLSFPFGGRDRGLCASSPWPQNPDRCGGAYMAVPWEMAKEFDEFLEPAGIAKSDKSPSDLERIRRDRKDLKECLRDDGDHGFELNAADDISALGNFSNDQLVDYCGTISEDAWITEISEAIIASTAGWTQSIDGQLDARVQKGVSGQLNAALYRTVERRFHFGWEEMNRQLRWCDCELPRRKNPANYANLAAVGGICEKFEETRSKTMSPPPVEVATRACYDTLPAAQGRPAPAVHPLDEPWSGYSRLRPWTFAERISVLEPDAMAPELWSPNQACGNSRSIAAMPREFAQRVSTVASAADAIQLAGALSAVFPGQGVGADLGVSRVQQAVGQAEAIERGPLIVGFSERGEELIDEVPGATQCRPSRSGQAARLGWVFGPPAFIEHEGRDSNLRLRHVVANHPVTADISVPGWWPYINLSVETAWVANWYDDLSGTGASVLSTRNDGERRRQEDLRVELPINRADLDGLLSAVSAPSLGRVVRRMRIDRLSPTTVGSCAGMVEVLAFGRDVWRGTEANLAGMKPKAIRVLPDMEGVGITFDLNEIARPLESETVDLTISTRSGSITRPLTIKGAKEKTRCGT